MPQVSLVQPRRSAPATIYGYLYQTCLGVLRWLNLEDNEILIFEGNEDLDRLILDRNAGIYEQVKALSGTVNISDRSVRESLENFLIAYVALRKEDADSHFVFRTTAHLRPQRTQGSATIDVLVRWKESEARGELIEALRNVLSKSDSELLAAARDWMEVDAQRWHDFVVAVDWKFGEPDLESVQREIVEELSRRPETRHLPATMLDLLGNRLVAEALGASSRRDVKQRARNREQLRALLGSVDQDLRTWAESTRALNLKSVLEEALSIESILDDNTLDLESKLGKKSPGKLLSAAYEIVPFDQAARQPELEDLAAWCDQAEPLKSVRLFHGEGGVGKTRLLIEWCQRVRHRGWHAGFLKREPDDGTVSMLFRAAAPRLIVLDYAEHRRLLVRRLLDRMAESLKKGPKLRLVLLSRRLADWWDVLPKEGDAIEDLIASSPEPRKVTDLVPAGPARRTAFRNAVNAFARELGRQELAMLPEFNLSHGDFNRVLYLHMAALDAIDGERPNARDALRRTLERERRSWRRLIRKLAANERIEAEMEQAVEKAVVALTLLGGSADLRQVQEAFESVLSIPSDLAADVLWILEEHYGVASPTGTPTLEPLQPDLLGEQLMDETWARDKALVEKVSDIAADWNALAPFMSVVLRLFERKVRGLDWGIIERPEYGLR